MPSRRRSGSIGSNQSAHVKLCTDASVSSIPCNSYADKPHSPPREDCECPYKDEVSLLKTGDIVMGMDGYRRKINASAPREDANKRYITLEELQSRGLLDPSGNVIYSVPGHKDLRGPPVRWSSTMPSSPSRVKLCSQICEESNQCAEPDCVSSPLCGVIRRCPTNDRLASAPEEVVAPRRKKNPSASLWAHAPSASSSSSNSAKSAHVRLRPRVSEVSIPCSQYSTTNTECWLPAGEEPAWPFKDEIALLKQGDIVKGQGGYRRRIASGQDPQRGLSKEDCDGVDCRPTKSKAPVRSLSKEDDERSNINEDIACRGVKDSVSLEPDQIVNRYVIDRVAARRASAHTPKVEGDDPHWGSKMSNANVGDRQCKASNVRPLRSDSNNSTKSVSTARSVRSILDAPTFEKFGGNANKMKVRVGVPGDEGVLKLKRFVDGMHYELRTDEWTVLVTNTPKKKIAWAIRKD